MTEPASRQAWSVPNALKVIFLTLGAIVLLLFLWYARALFLTSLLGVIFGLALASAADRLEKYRIRRSIGAPLLALLVIGSLVGLLSFVGPRLREQTRDLSKELPKVLETIEKKLGLGAGTVTAAAPVQPTPQQGAGGQATEAKKGDPAKKPQGMMQQLVAREGRTVGRLLFPVISTTAEALAGLLILIFIAIYIGVDPVTYRKGILHLVPHSHRARGREVLAEMDVTLRGWLTARLMAVVIIGAITAGALAALGVKGALALGVIAGLLEFVPFFGPIIAAVPAIGVALLDSPQKALYVVILYVFIQQIEGNLLTPMLLKKRLDVPPVLTIVAVSALGVVFGVLGMLTAEPIAAATMVLVKMLYVRDTVGDAVKLPE